MKKRKTGVIEFIVIMLMLCLSGCGQKQVALETVVTLNQDFSGNRQITLQINKKDFDTFFGGTTSQLNEQLEAICPSAFTWDYSEEEDSYRYTFTLSFSSLEDYEKNVSAVTGKDAVVSIEQPESVFASGLRYQENFDSVELLQWLGDFLETEGYLKQGQRDAMFSESSVKLIFQDEEYEQNSGAIQVDTLVETPVERIDILTRYMPNKHCDRQVIFRFSDNSMSKNGDAIKSYLEKNLPDGAAGVWSEKTGESLYTVSMEDLSSKQLNQSMQKLFGESESFINVQTEQRNGIFASAMNWSELVDVSDFSFGSNENITVGYYIQWEDGMEVSVHEQNSDTEIKLEESERYGGYQKVLEDKISSESLITQVSTTYVVDTIEVDTEFHSKDNLTRRIALVFQLQPDSEDQETIRKRIAQKAGRDAEVTNGEEREDGRSSIVIEQTGSIVEINQEFQAIFGVQGQLSHETSGNLMELHHTGSFADLMDFTQFLENDPVMTTLIYRLKLPGGEKIQADSVSSTVKLRQGTEEIDGRQYTGTLTGAYLSLTFSSRKWNTDGMMLFVLLIGFVLLAAAILLLADFIRKVFEKLRNGVRVFNGSFGQKDQILEDFPEDEDEEMDEDEDELEDEPEDEDEEKKETEGESEDEPEAKEEAEDESEDELEAKEEEEDALEDKREVKDEETDEGEGESENEPETKNEQTIAEEEKAPKNETEEEEVENLVERITEIPLEI